MKKKIILKNSIRKCVSLVLLFLFAFLYNITAQTKYLIKDEESFDYILNVDISNNTINGFTREKALLDYASPFSYRLIKLVSQLKHPEIIRFNAALNNQNFEGTFDFLFSSYKIVGHIGQDSISYSLFDKTDKLFKNCKGVKIVDDTKKNYEKLVEDVIRTTEENIFNPKLVRSKKWEEFCCKMKNAAPQIADDLEFQIGFFALIRNFDFSHFYVVRDMPMAEDIQETPSLMEVDQDIAVLKITNFSGNPEMYKLLLDSIEQKAYSNLIIDLRENPGGYFEPAFLVANFLTDKELISGFFPSRKWYEEYDRLPNKDDIDMFHCINGDSIQTYSDYGFYISTKDSESKFDGDVYLLVNRWTGSTAEVVTIGAKEYGLAKIAGEKTAGMLLSVKSFHLDKDIMLLVPVNDFISYNGYRVDKKGIKPDIKLKKGKELEQLIDIIKSKY